MSDPYRELADAVIGTMDYPDEWDQDGSELSILIRYVGQWQSVHPADRPDCSKSRHGGLHCLHYQEGDGGCCDCGRPIWSGALGEGLDD